MSENTVDISGIDKAELLVALHEHARFPRGPRPDSKLSIEEAQYAIDSGQHEFEHIKLRSVKVNIGGDEMDTWLYNRDNGRESAEAIVASLREKPITELGDSATQHGANSSQGRDVT